MQDDKLDIQKILQDAPDQAVDSENEIQEVEETTDNSQEVVAPDTPVIEPMAQTAEEVAEDESEEVVAPEVVEKAVEKKQSSQPKASREPLDADEKRDRVMKVLVPVLMVGFIFMAKKSFFPSPKESVAQKIHPAQTVKQNAKPQWQVPQEYPSSLRDPMKFGSVTGQLNEDAEGALVIKGIVFSSTPAAMISGKIVKTGDQIMGATVVEIKMGSVVFRSGDQQWEQKVKN